MTGFEEFIKWFSTLGKDQKKQILIYLEYLLENDWYRDMILFDINESLKQKLLQLKIIEVRSVEIPFRYGSPKKWERPFVSDGVKEEIKSFIKRELQNIITEDDVRNSLLKLISEKEWIFSRLLNFSPYTIDYSVGEELMKIGLGVVEKWISWGRNELTVFKLREHPFDASRLLEEVIKDIQKDRIKKRLNEVDKDVYLLLLFNFSDDEIAINLVESGIYPSDVVNISILKLKKDGNLLKDNIIREILLDGYKREVNKRLQEIFQKKYFTQLGILLTLSKFGKKLKDYFEIDKKTIEYFKDSLNFFKARKLLFEKKDKIIIPFLVIEEINNLLSSLGEVRIIENKEEAINFLEEVLEKTKKEVIIIDNYILPETIRKLIFPNVHPQAEIIVLTSLKSKESRKYWEEEAEKEYLKKDKDRRGRKLKVFVVEPKDVIYHDRYIIIDRKVVWHLGGSIKDLGKYEKYKVSMLPAWFVDDFYRSFKRNLEMLQKEGRIKYVIK